MIIALMLLLDVALMCYLAWKVGSAGKPQAPQDLGWLHFRDAPVSARKARPGSTEAGGQDA